MAEPFAGQPFSYWLGRSRVSTPIEGLKRTFRQAQRAAGLRMSKVDIVDW